MSCDNLPDNGRITRRVVCDFARLLDPALADWIAEHIAFPCSTVDRIVPATTAADRAAAGAELGVVDAWPLLTEPFLQWVIEDRFAGPRPAFERAGCELVAEVGPYEQMKLRMLNGSHSCIAYLGQLAGHETVAQGVADPLLRRFVHGLMTEEIMPTLALPVAELEEYRDRLLARFANAALNHRTAQIARDGSAKLPQRLLAPVRSRLAAGLPITRLALGVAAWILYCCRTPRVDDPAADTIAALARAAGEDPQALAEAFLTLEAVFGTDLARLESFRRPLVSALRRLAESGVAATLAADGPGPSPDLRKGQ
jgi:fructuronate reductase